MNTFNFEIIIDFVDSSKDPSCYVDALHEECSDALLGIGRVGGIGFEFSRESEECIDAIVSALDNIKSVIPDEQINKIEIKCYESCKSI